MTTLKSLLLGTAAGLVAVAGAQAADMPVKAKPVEYVKICTLYGAGYYYIPGSDTCIKIGGYIRADYGYNLTGARTPQYSGAAGAQDRTVAAFTTRHRANISIDTRTQSQYGTLRTLTSVHIQNENGSESFNVARAMIQWAGFTFGRIQSFQDTWNINDSWHFAQQQNNSDTGANGTNSIDYTFDLGGGLTLTFGADEVRRKSVTNLSNSGVIKLGAEPTTSAAGEQYMDPLVNFRVDQAWGYWSTTFVGHDASASYYTVGGACAAGGTTILTWCGHPANVMGWAAQTGAEVKLPQFGPADRMGATVRYAVGASGYGAGTNLSSASLFGSGNNVAVGSMTDGVYVNGSSIELTTTWTAQAGYEHSWTPTVKSSFTGAYTAVQYDSTAQGYFAAAVCAAKGANGSSFQAVSGNCNPNWSFFQGGIRTMWTPIPGFFLGVDGLYTQVWTAYSGSTAQISNTGSAIVGARPGGFYNINDQGIWSVTFRAQRNFNAGD